MTGKIEREKLSDSDLMAYLVKFHNWKRNYFTEIIVRDRISARELASKLGVSPQNMSNWLRLEEEKMSDSVRALIKVLREHENKNLV